VLSSTFHAGGELVYGRDGNPTWTALEAAIGALELAREDHVQRLVEHDLLAAAQPVGLDVRRDGHPQLAATGEDVDRAVLVRLQEHAVAAGRLGEPVDLLLEGHHLVPRLAERAGELLVALGERRHPALRLGQPLLQHPQVPGGLGQPAPQHRDLLLEEGHLRRELVHVLLVPRGAGLRVVPLCGHDHPPPAGIPCVKSPYTEHRPLGAFPRLG